MKSYEDIHSKSIRNAVWSLNQTEIVSVGFDHLCALTDIETGITNKYDKNLSIKFEINLKRKSKKSIGNK